MAKTVSSTDPEDEKGDQDRGEEEKRAAAEVPVGLTHDRNGGGGHEQAQKQGAGVAHEDLGRVEVVGKKADAQAR